VPVRLLRGPNPDTRRMHPLVGALTAAAKPRQERSVIPATRSWPAEQQIVRTESDGSGTALIDTTTAVDATTGRHPSV